MKRKEQWAEEAFSMMSRGRNSQKPFRFVEVWLAGFDFAKEEASKEAETKHESEIIKNIGEEYI